MIHNPGTIPDRDLANPGPDVTAVFEASYAEYRSVAMQERLAALVPYERARCAYFVHSVPLDEMQQLVSELCDRAQFVFATDRCDEFYVQFGPGWSEFIAAMQGQVPKSIPP